MRGLRAAARPLPRSAQRAARAQLVRLRQLGLRSSDAVLASYPKSGSTWLRFLLAHALTSDEADFDSVRRTVPPIGRHRGAPALLPAKGRLVRTHEPLGSLRELGGQRIVSLVRDGRDVAMSYLAHERRYGRASGDVVAFLDDFLAGRIDAYGTWHEHVLAALALEDSPTVKVLRVTYEAVRSDPVAELDRILGFLGVADRGPDATPLDDVVAASTKDRMRRKEATSGFLSSMSTDGSPFVRPDERAGWTELVPMEEQARFERICGHALRAAGYRA